MIRRVVYTNFQNHGHFILDPDPRITCLVGPSDSGKSALVRGLFWACLNRPGGSDFVRHGAESAGVKLYTRRHKIERTRSGRNNTYVLDGRVLKAFGLSNVPAEVAAALNLTEDNFRLQLDPHFWFSDSAGQVSQKLNEVVNLSLIDRALDFAATELRSAKSAVEFSQDRLKQAKDKLESLDWVPRYLRRAEAIERLEIESRAKSHRIACVASLVSNGRSLLRRRDRAKGCTLGAEKVVEIGKRAIEAAERVETITELVRKGRKLRRLAKLDLAPFDRLHALRTKGDALAERCRQIEMLVTRGRQLEDEVCRLTEETATLEKDASSIQKCPTCGRPIESPSPSSPPTFTYAKRRRSAGPKRTPGSPSSPGTLESLPPW